MKHHREYFLLLLPLYLSIPLCLSGTTSSFPPSSRPLRSGIYIWAGLILACIFSLLLPPGIIRTLLGTLFLLYVHTEYPKYTTGKPEEDYTIAINVVLTSLQYVDFVFLRSPEESAHRVDGAGRTKEDGKNLQSTSYWERLKWAASLFTTLRGIGWNWRVKNVEDVPPGITKWAFVRRQVLGFIYCYLATDILTYILLAHPATHVHSTADYFGLPLPTQVHLAWMLAFRSGFMMSLPFYLAAGVAVTLGLSRPQSWPPYFGSFAKGYTLRNIWGKCWHQNLRRIFETYSGLFCWLLGVRQGSLGSKYGKLYASFAISAFVHHAGARNNPYTEAVKWQFWFFLMQPVAIMVEDGVCFFGKEGEFLGLGDSKKKQKAVGFLWVFCFLSFSLRYMAAYVVACGFAEIEHPLTKVFSVARYVLNREATLSM